MRRLRSLLYVPADNRRFISGAHKRGADAIILDLEDSVQPANKLAARDSLTDSVSEAGQSGAAVFVRVNADPDLFQRDVEAAQKAGANGLVVPKLEQTGLLDTASTLWPGSGEKFVLGLVETPLGILNAPSIASHSSILGLMLGGQDFALSLGGQPDPVSLKLPHYLLHLAAKAHGRLSLGLGVSTDDQASPETVRAAIEGARRLGIDGSSCVHPSTVSLLNDGFSPSQKELDWARAVVAESRRPENRERGAFAVHGQMIDAPVLARAQRILGQGRDAE